MLAYDFNDAMCVYLGSALDSAGIQIGGGDARLKSAYGASAPEIAAKLDAVLDAAVSEAFSETIPKGVGPWLSRQFPSLSDICRQKIESHVQYNIMH